MELWGDAVKWGCDFKLNSSRECCLACKAMCDDQSRCVGVILGCSVMSRERFSFIFHSEEVFHKIKRDERKCEHLSSV